MPFGSPVHDVLQSLIDAAQLLAFSIVLFTVIVFIVKGQEMIALGRRAIAEVRLNLSWYFLDAMFVAPVIALIVAAIQAGVTGYSLQIVGTDTWNRLGRPLTFVAVIFLGDFVSYWRHRLEHTRWIWPVHAIHHSDTEMSWLTLARFHPINRAVTTCVDVSCLALLGFPAWALIANELVVPDFSNAQVDRPLAVSLPTRQCTIEKVSALKSVLANHPGTSALAPARCSHTTRWSRAGRASASRSWAATVSEAGRSLASSARRSAASTTRGSAATTSTRRSVSSRRGPSPSTASGIQSKAASSAANGT